MSRATREAHAMFRERSFVCHAKTCALCPADADRWSGAWLVNGNEWIGWCGNDHKNRWLNGERREATEPDGTEPEGPSS